MRVPALTRSIPRSTKRTVVRTAVLASLLSLVGVLGACNLFKPVADACSVTISPRDVTLPVNSTTAVLGTAFDCKGASIAKKVLKYSSSNAAVVTVSTTGQIFGIAVGTAKVSAVANNKSADANITVTPEHVQTVTVNPATVTLRRTETRQFTAIAKNSLGNVLTGINFVWASSNSSIASVTSSGLISAVAPGGPVTITATSDGQNGAALVTVTEVPIGTCSLAPQNQKVTVTQQANLILTLKDTAGNALSTVGRTLAWTSSNDIVATVAPTSGIVTARKAGTAVVTATDPSNAVVNCNANVEVVDPRIVTVRIQPVSAVLRKDVPRQYSVTMLDSVGGTIPPGRTVSWRNPTPAIATVSNSGVVTGIALGTGKVAVDAEGAVDTVTFTVTKIPVVTVTVAPLQRSVVEGQTAQFTPTVTDSAGNIVTDRVIDWLSSDITKATVSTTGLATSIAPGQVNISANTEGKSGSAQLIISAVPVDTILVVSNTVTQQVSKSIPYAITLKDAAGNILLNRTVTVTSDQPNFANGTVNAQATIVTITSTPTAGIAILTLQARNANNQPEGKPTKITVTVTP